MSSARQWYPLQTRRVAAHAAARAASRGPIDPLSGPQLALAGRVVTMNDAFSVQTDAIVYVEKGKIAAIQPRGQPAPHGFAACPVTETGGTLYPGLIELHNHLSYNALPLWSPVPRRFEHRGQWPNHKDYRPLVSGPMTVIGRYADAQGRFALVPALIRYVEAKCLLGGVTTSQGVKLASNSGIQRFYRGIVRNVEQTDEPELPEAQGRIPDVDARDAKAFLARLKKEDSCFLLHLSEGVSRRSTLSMARKHFLALEVAPGEWALSTTFAGIHATGLLATDFDVLAQHGSSMVWSPLSNLLLYGETARVDAARAAGVRIALGSDWSPTGSKNLLGELKVAWLHSQHALNGQISARDIVAMATRDAAQVLKWDKVLGCLAPGMRADLIVVDGAAGDPYLGLVRAKETDLRLVMINGIARYGVAELMANLAPRDQTVSVGGQSRRLYLQQETADPDVAAVSLSRAEATLREAFADLPKLARELERPRPVARAALDAHAPPKWTIALDEVCACGVEFAPRLAFNGPRDVSGPQRAPRPLAATAAKLSAVLRPLELDRLTVADDASFLDRIELQPNVPAPLRSQLRSLY
jgi:5-methylthioadenosine/S-adenosylhomocysteine deaminase